MVVEKRSISISPGKTEHPGEAPNEEAFTYPGPNPFTKEQAILMMADSVEAASRSLPEYTEESISNLVDKIIDSQVAEGYFKECPSPSRISHREERIQGEAEDYIPYPHQLSRT